MECNAMHGIERKTGEVKGNTAHQINEERRISDQS